MHQEFVSSRNVYVDRDQQGIARQLLHIDQPFVTHAHNAQLSAALYLERFADLLEVTPNQLKNLSLSPATNLDRTTPEEFRFLLEKQQFDSATLVYSQTIFGIPVWRAGVAVQIKQNPDRVISSQSTQHKDLKVSEPTDKANRLLETMEAKSLGEVLGLGRQTGDAPSYELDSLAIDSKSLVVFRYESAQRVPGGAGQQPPASSPNEPRFGATENTSLQKQEALPTLPLPAVRDGIQDGQHYVCLEVNFALRMRGVGLLHWIAIVEVETASVLYLRPFIDHVSGMVIERDPITDIGTGLPSSTTAAINAARVSRTLVGLNGPVAGVQSLVGDTIQMSDVEAPTVASPTEPSGTNFNFDSRTNNFAAVNAYYHCDNFFRLTDSMGFTRPSFYGGTSFPTVADHRGSMNTTDGLEINAHCVGTAGGVGIGRTTFALADLGDTANPIGIACDNRVALHELAGHGVLYNQVHSPNFGFSHSAGDSVAVIQNDPGSVAPDRFLSFPWVNIGRRHDRTPASGWGWSGNIALNPFSSTFDYGGYKNEQILSTTLFRLYRSIGGDSADLNMKRFAARVSIYLVMRAIATLTPATNPANAAGFVSALMTADQGDWVSENLTGGAYSKVIRWAFEKQGLYQPSGTAVPNNNAGAPPAVDVYIDDGRAGEYTFQPNWWSTQTIWNRRHADGGTTHEEPIVGKTNYGYVKLKNRGTQTALNIVVKAFHANPAAGLSYPNDWSPMTTAQLTAASVAPNNSGEIVVGPFQWTPLHAGHECMFMIVSANGDSSNIDRIAAGDSIPEWRLVPNDNNIGQRNVAPVPGSGTSGLTGAFKNRQFLLKNPNNTVARMELRAEMPELLRSRGWTLSFVNAGGAAFSLRPGESRTVVMALEAGHDFTRADISREHEPTIQITGHADGILVGGMSYLLDPKLDHVPAEQPGEPKPQHQTDACSTNAAELLRCIESQHHAVRKVVMRKVNVDIDFEDDCC